MNCIGYFRGTQAEGLRARLNEYAAAHGIDLMDIYSDEPGCFSAFRELENAVKFGLCDIVLLPAYDSLADDRYLMLENKLFLLRNGVKPVFVSKGGYDNRHEIALNISRYFSYITDWDASYGVSMPLKNTFSEFKRTPPIGYKIVDGKALIDKNEANAVREIFTRYAAGDPLKDIYKTVGDKYGFGDKLGNMTVKTVLKNERYLGRMSKKGYHLPALIRYDEWLAVKERLEREYGKVLGNEPFKAVAYSDAPIAYYRGDLQKYSAEKLSRFDRSLIFDTERFEEELMRLIGELASETNAETLFCEHVLTERKRASAALPKAEAMLRSINEAVFRDLVLVKNGERSEEVQDRLGRNNDVRVFSEMRIRRIRSEAVLYSIKKDKVAYFFERARNIKNASFEEKAFIADAFVSSVSVRTGKVRVVLRDPTSPKRRSVIIDNCISE